MKAQKKLVLDTLNQAAKSNSLPQVTQAKLANLKIDQPEKAGRNFTETGNLGKITPWSTDTGYHCFRTNLTGSYAESKNKNAYENDKAQAMRIYVEEADAWFDKEEATAVRLFEWLKDQTDSNESRQECMSFSSVMSISNSFPIINTSLCHDYVKSSTSN